MQKFERFGAQASVEIQAAGRKVAKENTLLRALLKQRGITSVEIGNYLHSEPGESETASSAMITPSVATTPLRQPQLRDGTEISQVSEVGTFLRQSSESLYQMHAHKALPSTEPDDSPHQASPAISEPISQSHSYDMPQTPSLLHDLASPSPLSTDNGLKCFDSPGLGNRSQNTDDATSCEIAVGIIVGMRGHDDTEDVRAELGCSSSLDCTVGNVTIFQVMDR